jgi:hypothetical protein
MCWRQGDKDVSKCAVEKYYLPSQDKIADNILVHSDGKIKSQTQNMQHGWV